jgi:hypothetical protein
MLKIVVRWFAMKVRLLIGIVVASMLFPPVSHGFGLLRFVYDGIFNQFGLDRGPIPKTPPRGTPAKYGAACNAPVKPASQRVYIQAEGF